MQACEARNAGRAARQRPGGGGWLCVASRQPAVPRCDAQIRRRFTVTVRRVGIACHAARV
ncbi:hypothetical protein AQ611_19650 [Burkholderia singularis]|nr:hypothetical protein AQ611_19650 [Burkholderia sp. Bp7605]